jgi:hypothetical protein
MHLAPSLSFHPTALAIYFFLFEPAAIDEKNRQRRLDNGEQKATRPEEYEGMSCARTQMEASLPLSAGRR